MLVEDVEHVQQAAAKEFTIQETNKRRNDKHIIIRIL